MFYFFSSNRPLALRNFSHIYIYLYLFIYLSIYLFLGLFDYIQKSILEKPYIKSQTFCNPRFIRSPLPTGLPGVVPFPCTVPSPVLCLPQHRLVPVAILVGRYCHPTPSRLPEPSIFSAISIDKFLMLLSIQ